MYPLKRANRTKANEWIHLSHIVTNAENSVSQPRHQRFTFRPVQLERVERCLQIIGQKRRAEQRQRTVTLAMNQDLYALIFVTSESNSGFGRHEMPPPVHHPTTRLILQLVSRQENQ